MHTSFCCSIKLGTVGSFSWMVGSDKDGMKVALGTQKSRQSSQYLPPAANCIANLHGRWQVWLLKLHETA